jgi:uncharacterized damage-inducible protein DinB
MMKDILTEFADFNHWANQRITASIVKLPEQMHLQKVDSSFPSLHATVLHMWDAESAWWHRVKQQERQIVPGKTNQPQMKEVVEGLLLQSALWVEFVSETSPAILETQISYRSFRGDAYTQPLYQILLHVFNHSTYHRGQLVTMMRNLGITEVPATDFILWSRKK